MAGQLSSDPDAYRGVLLPHWVAGSAVERETLNVLVDPRSGALVPVASTEEVDGFLSEIAPALPRWLALGDAERRDAVLAMADAIRARTAQLTDVLMFEFSIDEELAATQVRRSWQRISDIAREPDVHHERVAPGICSFVLSRHRAGKILSASLARVVLNESIVVVKPSLFTPLTTHLLAEAICEAMPSGVVNLIHGDDETVDAIVSSPLVGSIFVDGSPEAESHVSRLGAVFHKPVVRYAEDSRFAGSGDVTGSSPTTDHREESDRKE